MTDLIQTRTLHYDSLLSEIILLITHYFVTVGKAMQTLFMKSLFTKLGKNL